MSSVAELTVTSSYPYESRLEAANTWHSSANSVAISTDNITAQRILDFLSPSNGCSVTEPIANGQNWGLRGKTSQDAHSITPLDESDKSIHQYFAGIYDRHTPTYMEQERTIYMSTDGFPGIMGGIVLQHEGLHAYAHAQGHWRDFPDKWGHWFEEVIVFDFENDILRNIGGDEYRDHIRRWSPTIASRLANGATTGTELYEGLPKADIHELIEPGMSTAEQNMLSSAFLIDAVFYGLHPGFTLPDDISTHAAFLCWLYADTKPTSAVPQMLRSKQAALSDII